MRNITFFAAFVLIGVGVALLSFPQISKVRNFGKKTFATPTVSSENKEIRVFLIALNDNGVLGKKIGCGDSVVAFSPPPHSYPISTTKLENAYNDLLNLNPNTYKSSGLASALSASNLKLDKAEVKEGVAYIKISGRVSLAGVCDSPRFQAQLEEEALQFPEIREVRITINGRTLDEVLSGKGI